jgi:hypothetical protein
VELNLIPFDYTNRVNEVMRLAWRIFISQFVNKRHSILTEAPFQHHFAQIIRQIGNLYCLSREDLFLVDLETQCKDIKGKTKYFDITCEYVNNINCAIELKFKKASQGAQDHGRIDMYTDIEALELAKTKGHFGMGKFYVITDSAAYVKESKVGVGTHFRTHHGHDTVANKSFHVDSPGRSHITVTLDKSYAFRWEKIEKWYFLEMAI